MTELCSPLVGGLVPEPTYAGIPYSEYVSYFKLCGSIILTERLSRGISKSRRERLSLMSLLFNRWRNVTLFSSDTFASLLPSKLSPKNTYKDEGRYDPSTPLDVQLDFVDALRSTESQCSLLETRNSHLDRHIAMLENKLANTLEKLSEKQRELNTMTFSNSSLRTQLAAHQSLLVDKMTKISSLKNTQNQLRQVCESQEAHVKVLEGEVSSLSSSRDGLRSRVNHLNSDVVRLESSLRDEVFVVGEQRKMIEELKTEVGTLQTVEKERNDALGRVSDLEKESVEAGTLMDHIAIMERRIVELNQNLLTKRSRSGPEEEEDMTVLLRRAKSGSDVLQLESQKQELQEKCLRLDNALKRRVADLQWTTRELARSDEKCRALQDVIQTMGKRYKSALRCIAESKREELHHIQVSARKRARDLSATSKMPPSRRYRQSRRKTLAPQEKSRDATTGPTRKRSRRKPTGVRNKENEADDFTEEDLERIIKTRRPPDDPTKFRRFSGLARFHSFGGGYVHDPDLKRNGWNM